MFTYTPMPTPKTLRQYTNPDQGYGVTDGRGKAILDVFSSSTRQIHTRWVYNHPASLIVMATLLIGAIASTPTFAKTPPSSDFAQRIETAHGLAAWQAHKAVRAHIKIEMGGQSVLQGTMLFDTPVGKSRIKLDDGTVMVFDGQDAWVSPSDSPLEGARFHLLTWSYFLAAPMKLRDPGSHLVPLDPMPQAGRELPAAKLTFDAGVGDSPDDWYILYRDPDTQHLVAMAYIVTYGKDKEEAEKEPHAITFDDFETIDGVTFSTRWQFWHWDPQLGTHGQPMGHAQITDIQFVEPAPQDFQKPTDAKRDAPPQ